ncbi:MAG: hypothetical protein ACOYMZ_01730 [Minisyncoccia bacterium]
MRTSVIFGYVFILLFGVVLVQVLFFPGDSTNEQQTNALVFDVFFLLVGVVSLIYAKRKYGAATLK